MAKFTETFYHKYPSSGAGDVANSFADCISKDSFTSEDISADRLVLLSVMDK